MDKKSLWLYASRGVMVLAGLGTHFLFARIGGVEGYGVLSLFLSLALIFNNLTDFGISLNGPRLLADQVWGDFSFMAQWVRKRLSLISSIGYLLAVLLFYPDQWLVLVWGLPMILFFGYQADWLLRGQGRPDRAAFRQMAQSLLQLTGLALVWWLASSIANALAVYALAGAASFLLANWLWVTPATSVFSRTKLKQLMGLQMAVFTGFILQNFHYILGVPLLVFLTDAAEGGLYASHFFLFTSLATLSVITMEVFMGKPKAERQAYGQWLVVFTALAMFGLLASYWYFPLLYGTKGFSWQLELTMLTLVLLWLHAGRLFWVNRLLFSGGNKRFGRLNVLSLSVHLGLWTLALLFGVEINAARPLQFLILSEVVMLIYQGIDAMRVTRKGALA